MILLQKCLLYAPDFLGEKDILVGGSKILAVEDKIDLPDFPAVESLNARGLFTVPGFIDGHVHISGAGGEGGPATRTPPLKLSQMIKSGSTTVIGLLGTDGFTRDVREVLMKAKSLRAQGVSAWVLTGSYQVPLKTIFDNPGEDISMIEEIVGAGEIALADHRSSGVTVNELIRLAGNCRVGGMLGGKGGIVVCHMGNGKDPFRILYQVEQKSEIKLSQFLPTHCNRNNHILNEAIKYGKKSHLDLSAYDDKKGHGLNAAKAANILLEAGVPAEHLTFSSDGCGSLPVFDTKGNLVKLESGDPRSLYKEFKNLVNVQNWSLERALKPVTSNVAAIFKLKDKGELKIGADADILLLDQKLNLVSYIANGVFMLKDGKLLKKGNFED